ncbi:hypothetical protein [Streptomyces alkaliterrae]|uniref:DoxX family protein n=1 Tax=Streptomyces alkaliterrae TaxID=2213162 RepID=A0A5P0YSA1_9ACTN|nr:hypothetical protein [Streptomyces alkaliterrae]MBB1255316.1 hypothetical protein [Streptomyces alkaliterrae]MBB1261616.1 hypothetical protein [Streptomyces alkaliterrae]MQS03148.1 hypothetical protein [Streptomyces alkaliterrae]
MLKILGYVILIQGVLGFGGLVLRDRAMGFVHTFADVPPAGYLALTLVGGLLAFWPARTGER